MNEPGGPDSIDVSTSLGTLRGRWVGSVAVFRGIRYAKAPTGARRFRPPVPVDPWEGVHDALEFAPICPQVVIPFFGPSEPEVQGEDCLALNVWTTAISAAAPRPVMVWIHGGAFVSGSGSQPLFDGGNLAAHDVVVVSLNYRLHILGFFDLEEADPEFAGSANAGLLDIVAGLRWVSDHIAAFGGDPDNVTVFGESAGAALVGALLATPSASGLFRRAICQSGTGHHTRSKAVAGRATTHACRVLGMDVVDIQQLQALPIERIVEMLPRLGAEMSPEESAALFSSDDPLNAMPFRMTHGDSVVPRRPMDAIADGAAAGIDVIVGANDDEFQLFRVMSGGSTAGFASLHEHAAVLQSSVDELLSTYRVDAPGRSEDDVCTAMSSDLWFILAGRDLAEALCRFNSRTYRYAFSWKSTALGGVLGACHGLELPFVFGRTSAMRELLGEEPPVALATAMQQAWASFAHTGDPGWPNWNSRQVMRFDAESRVVADPEAARVALWKSVFTFLK